MVIQVDTREKPRAIEKILAEFDRRNVRHVSSKLLVGDYMNLDNPRVIIDRKQNLLEVCCNVCQGHERFRKELMLAYSCDIQMIVLIEHGYGIESIEDVIFWDNPRLYESPHALNGERLYHTMKTMERKYHVRWEFCTKEQTGAKILELLGGEDAGMDKTTQENM